jgi:hypothetical protein
MACASDVCTDYGCKYECVVKNVRHWLEKGQEVKNFYRPILRESRKLMDDLEDLKIEHWITEELLVMATIPAPPVCETNENDDTWGTYDGGEDQTGVISDETQRRDRVLENRSSESRGYELRELAESIPQASMPMTDEISDKLLG